MKFGARILKTGLSVLLALFVASLLNFDTVFIAGIAASISVFPSIHKSWKHLYQQILGNAIGATFAILGYMFLGSSPFTTAFIVVLVISTNLALKLNDTINLSVIVAIVIMSLPSEDYIEFALIRVLLVLIGIFSALIVNFLFLPPKNEKKLIASTKSLNKDMFLYLRFFSSNNKEILSKLKKEVKTLSSSIDKLESTYKLFLDEYRSSLTKKTLKDKKKLIVFRQIINTSKEELKLIKILVNNQTVYNTIDSDVLKSIQDEISDLCLYHEKIFFKFEKDIDSAETIISSKVLLKKNKQLANDLILSYKENDFQDWCEILPIVNKLINVAYELEKLERFIDNYMKKKN